MIVCLVQITSLKLLAGVFEYTQGSHLGLLSEAMSVVRRAFHTVKGEAAMASHNPRPCFCPVVLSNQQLSRFNRAIYGKAYFFMFSHSTMRS